MKKYVLLVLFILMSASLLRAQTNFGIGLQKELFGVSLNAQDKEEATFNVDKVDVSLLIKEHLRIGVGFQSGTLVNHETKRYEPKTGLSLNAAYLFTFKDNKDYAIAPTISLGNSFKNFMSFQNFDMDLGVRTYMFKSLYLGTGLRYAKWKSSTIVNDSQCFSWYWEIGFNFYFKPRH